MNRTIKSWKLWIPVEIPISLRRPWQSLSREPSSWQMYHFAHTFGNGDLTCMKPHTIVYKYVFRVSSIAYRNIFLQIWYDRPVNVAQRARTLLPCAVAPSVPSSLSSFTFLPSLCVLWQRHLHTLSQTSETTKLHHQKYNVCAPFNHLRSYNIIEIWISYIFPLCFGPKVNLY